MADYDQIMKALRNAHAAGDTAAASRLAAMAKAAKGQGRVAVPDGFDIGTGEVQTNGPGPGGRIDPALYDMGAIAKRFVPGEMPDRRPQVAVAGDGSEMVLNPATGQYTSRELMAGNIRPSLGGALQAGAAQGVTMGVGDEIAGAIGGPFVRERARATLDAARRDRPGATLTGEVAGALALPAASATTTRTVGEAVKTGAKVGAVYGGGYAAASSDGGFMPRLKDGVEGAVSGAIFGAAAPAAINYGSKAFRRLFGVSAKKPTIQSLKATRDAAYSAVDSAGERFSSGELKAMAQRAAAGLDDIDYLPEVDVVTSGMIKRMDGMADRDLTLGQLDKFRRAVFERYNNSKEPGLLEIIDAIDETITSRASTSELLDAARLSHSRYKKAELLDLAFQKASDQTNSTGSGGNILNKYRQAVTSIINNPKQARWFSADEIGAMRSFVEGTQTQNALRLIGKLSPGGNGLMTALNLGAVSAEPGMLAVTATATGAKAIADRATQRQADGLISRVGGGAVAQPFRPTTTPRLNALAGPLSQFGP